MGSKSWEIDVTDPSVLKTGTQVWGNDATEVTDSTKTITIKVDYDKALEDAKSTATGSMGAILAAAGVSTGDISSQASGNIIDIMNTAINGTSGAVKGDTLIALLRRYISVTYTYNNASFYTTSGRKLADVFNSAYAAWDADLYTALGRCFVTSGTYLGDEVKESKLTYLLSGRQNRTDRYNDTVALAGELYGVRGLESRYQYTYITADGVITDARTHEATFEALEKMNDLTKEGLFAPLVSGITITGDEASHSGSQNSGIQTLSLHDYVQTQTAKQGFRSEDLGEDASSYNFAPVLTSVSNWDTDDDGTKDTIMRFTESWRSVKTTGFGISYKGVKDDPDKLAACLAFIDYLFSNDGQILMTYGPQASANDDGSVSAASSSTGGFWYGTEVTSVSLSDTTKFKKISEATNYAPAQYESLDSNYFVYNEKIYTGTFYNGRQIPTMTASSKAMFRNSKLGNGSFTNYARYYIGTTLPIGNKDQGFEYQCTAKCGLAGADIVAIALNNGTIQHPVQQVPTFSTNAKNDWYTLVPTSLFYDSDVTDILKQSTYSVVTGMGDTHIFTNSSSSSGNFFHDIEAYGFDGTKNVTLLTSQNIKLPTSAAAAVTFLNTYNMKNFEEFIQEAFDNLVGVYVTK
jgi:putative aldouronate transport system substrate-binding protein